MHHLKTRAKPFPAAWDEVKLFEIRYDDRNFQVGDSVTLAEWEPIGATCRVCPADAACRGAYEGQEEEEFSCDKHCGHGNEDGHCVPVGYTGREIVGKIGYISRGPEWGLPEGLVVFSLVKSMTVEIKKGLRS